MTPTYQSSDEILMAYRANSSAAAEHAVLPQPYKSAAELLAAYNQGKNQG